MTNLINKFLNANSNREVNQIVNDNLDLLNKTPALFIFAKNARRRITKIQREKRKSWMIYEMN